MTRLGMGLLGLPALAAVLAGCAAPPAPGGRTEASPSQAATQDPGPGWLLLGSDEEGSLYMHPRSTLRAGSSALIMLLGSKRQPVVLAGGVSVGSVKEHIEIDCDARRLRLHDATAHPDPVGLGPVLGRVGRQEQWKGFDPNTIMGAVASAVCSATAPDAPRPAPAAPPLQRNRRATFST